jgi:hypothetical protein
MDIKEIGCGLDSNGSVYVHVTGCCIHGNEPSGSIKGGEFINQQATTSFSGKTPLRGVMNLGKKL